MDGEFDRPLDPPPLAAGALLPEEGGVDDGGAVVLRFIDELFPGDEVGGATGGAVGASPDDVMVLIFFVSEKNFEF